MNPQDRTDGAVAGRQEGSYGQELGLDPDAVGEQWSEGGQDGYDLRWQIQGGRSPRTMARMSPSIVANDPLDLPADLAKVEWELLAAKHLGCADPTPFGRPKPALTGSRPRRTRRAGCAGTGRTARRRRAGCRGRPCGSAPRRGPGRASQR